MSTQITSGSVILKNNHHSTRENNGWGLEHYFTHKPENLLPLIEGYEVHEGALIPKKEETDNVNKTTLIGENLQINDDEYLESSN